MPPKSEVAGTVTSAVAPSKFARLPTAVQMPAPLPPWPHVTAGFVEGRPGDAAQLAQLYYGDASLAGLLEVVPRGFLVQPGALLPKYRQAHEGAVVAQTAWTTRAFNEALPNFGAAQRILLEGLRAQPHPEAQTSLLQAAVRSLGSGRDLSSLLPADGPDTAAILGGLLGTPLAPAGSVELGVTLLLDWMAQGDESSSGKTRALLLGLPGPVQAQLLSNLAQHFDESGVLGAAKYGEPTPGHMLQRFFESMVPQDRTETLSGLVTHGVLTEAGGARLQQGRSTAGRLAPMLTWGAHLAVQDYARWANEGSKWAMLGGGLASLALPETAGETVVTLASVGLGGGLAARFPTLATALAVPSTGLASYSTTLNLQAGLTGKDPVSGRTLEPGVTLARLVAGASGVLLTAGGLLMGFRAGRVRYSHRPSVTELHRLRLTHQQVQIEGLPRGTTVYVPRGTYTGAAPARPSPARLPARAMKQVSASPSKPVLAPGAASAAEAENVAASLAGSQVKVLMAPHEFGEMEVAARAALLAQAKLSARTAYLTARGEGATHKKAMKTANFAVKKALPEVTKRLAKEAALLELETRIGDGRIFDRGAMSPVARARLQAFEAGTVGQQAKAWAIRLGKATPRQIRALMDLEVAAGRATRRDVQLSIPKPQVMSVWETPDGTVVRLKPSGDLQRRGPTVSVELKIDSSIPDSGLVGIALKVDGLGRAVPSSSHMLQDPFLSGGEQSGAFTKYGMDAGHWAVSARDN